MVNSEHPKVGEYYLLDNNLIEVMKIERNNIPVMRKKVKEKWFHTQEYEKTGEVDTSIKLVWWWVVGESKLPGKGLINSKDNSPYYNWDDMNLKASVLIHQARIIHTLQERKNGE